ncbi:MAG: aldo/keto reductase, partial [Planctomycetota bacterium]
RHGLDRGIFWWDLADTYGTHPFARAALKEIKREKVVINSKVWPRETDEVGKVLERFFRELDTDYIDIVLLHCMRKADWPKTMKRPMEVLREYKEKRRIRALGVSCHAVGALQAAVEEPWVDICLARFNPFAKVMDVDKPERVPHVAKVLKKMHENGKVVYGMKILGEGYAKTDKQVDEALRFALQQRWMSAFTIGMNTTAEVDDIIRRVKRLRIMASRS